MGCIFQWCRPTKFRGDRKTGEEFSMSIENVDKGYASKNGTKSRQLLSLFAGLALALTIGASNAKAQIAGDLEVKVAFDFHAGNSDFPGGEHRIRPGGTSGRGLET